MVTTEMFELPTDFGERRRVLMQEYQRTFRAEFAHDISKIIAKYKDVIAQHNDGATVHSLEMEFSWEYNDEGGNDPHLYRVYLYDADGNSLDTEFRVEQKSSWSGEYFDYDFDEVIREDIWDNFSSEELVKYIGESRIYLTASGVIIED
jgi:hypothetical protein